MHCPADAMGGVPAPRPPRATPAARIKPLTIRRRPRLLVAFAAREALIRSKEPWDPFCASILTSPLGGFPECHFASDPPCACSGEAHCRSKQESSYCSTQRGVSDTTENRRTSSSKLRFLSKCSSLAQWQFVTRSVARFFEGSAKRVEAVSRGSPEVS